MVLGIQMLGIAFGVAVLYVTFLNYKRREFTLNEFGFWSAVALGVALLAVFPSMLDPIVETLNISRTLDFLIIMGFIFLITASFYTYLVTRRTQRMVEEVVRRIAMEQAREGTKAKRTSRGKK